MTSGISILGSTGSIGTQTLDVAHGLGIKVHALAAGKNTKMLAEQAAKFNPEIISLPNEELRDRFLNDYKMIMGKNFVGSVNTGNAGLCEVATETKAQTVVVALVGILGLNPTLAAIDAGKNIALANKETLVTGGELVMKSAAAKGVKIFPVDSEHSAIFQSISGNRAEDINRIILTASGGPFRNFTKEELYNADVSQALNHPNWKMGRKISVDSATLMNKGLELIEARWLFDMEPERIEVIVHPQSIIHSMVEYRDGSVIAQMGIADMRIPIQLALTWPRRVAGNWPALNFAKTEPLTFELPDIERFPCLALAYKSIEMGKCMPILLNAANEIAVEKFLDGSIGFMDIPDIINYVMLNCVMNESNVNIIKTAEDIMAIDQEARNFTTRYVSEIMSRRNKD